MIDTARSAPVNGVPSFRRKLLLIDDDPSMHDAIARRLRSHDIDVISAYHGMHGYWTALTEKPDVIVTDLRMPSGDGEYVVDCLKANVETAGIPVIVLTGARDLNLERRLRRFGVRRYLTKPVSLDRLLEAITEQIGRTVAASSENGTSQPHSPSLPG